MYYTEENMKIVERFCKIADDIGCTPAQLATAWVARQPGISAVLLGVRTIEHFEEGIKAVKVEEKLTDSDIKRISSLTDRRVQESIWKM